MALGCRASVSESSRRAASYPHSQGQPEQDHLQPRHPPIQNGWLRKEREEAIQRARWNRGEQCPIGQERLAEHQVNDGNEVRQVDAGDECAEHQREQPRVAVRIPLREHDASHDEERKRIQAQEVERQELREGELDSFELPWEMKCAELDRDVVKTRVNLALDGQADRFSRPAAIDGVPVSIDRFERAAVDGDNAIPGGQAGSGGWSGRLDAIDAHRSLAVGVLARQPEARRRKAVAVVVHQRRAVAGHGQQEDDGAELEQRTWSSHGGTPDDTPGARQPSLAFARLC